jgi:hypothetical protein
MDTEDCMADFIEKEQRAGRSSLVSTGAAENVKCRAIHMSV